jgi:flagellar basal body rod protein FlgB
VGYVSAIANAVANAEVPVFSAGEMSLPSFATVLNGHPRA